jgi:hypothetical protein
MQKTLLIICLLAASTLAFSAYSTKAQKNSHIEDIELALTVKDYKKAQDSIKKLDDLIRRNKLSIPNKLWYYKAQTALHYDDIRNARKFALNYISLTGLKGEFHKHSLKVLSQARIARTKNISSKKRADTNKRADRAKQRRTNKRRCERLSSNGLSTFDEKNSCR